MEGSLAPRARRRATLLADAGALAWIVLWIVLGTMVSSQVRQLTTVGDTLTSSGGALIRTGTALRSEADLPFVGPRVAQFAGQVTAAGRQAQASGRTSRESVERLSVLLGVSVAGIAAVPVLFAYVPFRVIRARQRSAGVATAPPPGAGVSARHEGTAA